MKSELYCWPISKSLWNSFTFLKFILLTARYTFRMLVYVALKIWRDLPAPAFLKKMTNLRKLSELYEVLVPPQSAFAKSWRYSNYLVLTINFHFANERLQQKVEVDSCPFSVTNAFSITQGVQLCMIFMCPGRRIRYQIRQFTLNRGRGVKSPSELEPMSRRLNWKSWNFGIDFQISQMLRWS